MLKIFAKYTSIGVLNTLIHWFTFAVCIYAFGSGQAIANFLGFSLAVTFSFFANARFTFRTTVSCRRYILYITFMGALSLIIGWFADFLALPPIITLMTFSATSLICGFIYSKFIVFRDLK